MDLKDINTKWENLKHQEAELQRQLDENHSAQTAFIHEVAPDGFCWVKDHWEKYEVVNGRWTEKKVIL
jgi:phosphopantetheinyl transferase